MFLKTGAQLPNGRFSIPVRGPVPNGFEVPGTIKYSTVVARLITSINYILMITFVPDTDTMM